MRFVHDDLAIVLSHQRRLFEGG